MSEVKPAFPSFRMCLLSPQIDRGSIFVFSLAITASACLGAPNAYGAACQHPLPPLPLPLLLTSTPTSPTDNTSSSSGSGNRDDDGGSLSHPQTSTAGDALADFDFRSSVGSAHAPAPEEASGEGSAADGGGERGGRSPFLFGGSIPLACAEPPTGEKHGNGRGGYRVSPQAFTLTLPHDAEFLIVDLQTDGQDGATDGSDAPPSVGELEGEGTKKGAAVQLWLVRSASPGTLEPTGGSNVNTVAGTGHNGNYSSVLDQGGALRVPVTPGQPMAGLLAGDWLLKVVPGGGAIGKDGEGRGGEGRGVTGGVCPTLSWRVAVCPFALVGPNCTQHIKELQVREEALMRMFFCVKPQFFSFKGRLITSTDSTAALHV